MIATVMMFKWKAVNILVCTVLMLAAIVITTQASVPEVQVPTGFYKVKSDDGVILYRKDYPGGNPDFVQVIDLKLGASVQLLRGEITDKRAGQGVYGGDDPRIQSKSLNQFWKEINSESGEVFCVTNGLFFLMGESPTRLPFPLKINNEIISDGYGKNEHADQKLMLEVWDDKAEIRPFSQQVLYSSSAPNIIVGLTEDARKSPTKYLARTFVGIDDHNGDGRYETILIFSTRTSRQKDAARVLRDFGADKVMMLDGGGSTQLICQGKTYISSDRKIPQAIAVISAVEGQTSSPVLSLFGFDTSANTGQSSSLDSVDPVGNLFDLKWIFLTMVLIALVLVIVIGRSRQGYY